MDPLHDVGEGESDQILVEASAFLSEGNAIPLDWAVRDGERLPEAWNASRAPSRLTFIAEHVFQHTQIVYAMAALARSVLRCFPEGESLPLRVIEAVERWTRDPGHGNAEIVYDLNEMLTESKFVAAMKRGHQSARSAETALSYLCDTVDPNTNNGPLFVVARTRAALGKGCDDAALASIIRAHLPPLDLLTLAAGIERRRLQL